MPIDLLIGPAGAGKNAAAEEVLEADDEVLIDLSLLATAIYPHRQGNVRTATQLALLRRVRGALVSIASEQGLRGVMTLSTADEGVISRWQAKLGGGVAVLDPGRDVVERRLEKSQPGRSGPCTDAVNRWYGTGNTTVTPEPKRDGWTSSSGRFYPAFKG